MTEKKHRDLLMETNRRLQETTQQLFMAKQELEKKNKELEKARQREHQQRQQLERELTGLKQLSSGAVKPVPGKKLTKDAAEDLSLRYIHLLESYIKEKKLGEEEPLIEKFCRRLIEYNVTPKGIIDLHLKAMPQVKTIGGLETTRITFEARMVLLAVMTRYANLLKEGGN